MSDIPLLSITLRARPTFITWFFWPVRRGSYLNSYVSNILKMENVATEDIWSIYWRLWLYQEGFVQTKIENYRDSDRICSGCFTCTFSSKLYNGC